MCQLPEAVCVRKSCESCNQTVSKMGLWMCTQIKLINADSDLISLESAQFRTSWSDCFFLDKIHSESYTVFKFSFYYGNYHTVFCYFVKLFISPISFKASGINLLLLVTAKLDNCIPAVACVHAPLSGISIYWKKVFRCCLAIPFHVAAFC